ncbi:MAG: hypothetical protein J5871_04275 [Bacteroidales bacterium]|nr:hypothetical protein [Bacteroidales bacterium]
MRKPVFLLAAAMLAALSCQKEQQNAPATDGLAAFSFSGAMTKTAIGSLSGSTATVRWTEGDDVIVFSDKSDGTGHRFSATLNGDGSRAMFSGNIDNQSTAFYALYPYSSSVTYADGMLNGISLPALQTAVSGTFADKLAPTLGQGTRTPGQVEAAGVNFENLCAVLSFQMPDYVNNAIQVEIESKSGTAMTGEASVNLSTGEMSVSGGNSVLLEGSFAAGARYFAVVAPALYENGFVIVITTKSGASYTAETTRNLPAEPGEIYNLGTLGFVLDVAPEFSFELSRNASGDITGTDVYVTGIPVDDDLEGFFTVSSITLRRDNVLYRSLTGASSGKMTVENGWTYLPKGSYTVEVAYSRISGSNKVGVFQTTVPAPSFAVSVDGYTSYSYGKGNINGRVKNVSTANTLDNSSIYDLSARVSIAPELLADSRYGETSFSYNFNEGGDVAIDGNVTPDELLLQEDLPWGSYTFSASCTFDGVTASSGDTYYVTGLPWRENPLEVGNWTQSAPATGSTTWTGNGCKMSQRLNSTSPARSITLNRTFALPAEVSVSVLSNITLSTYAYKQKLLGGYVYTPGVLIISAAGTSETYTASTTSGGEQPIGEVSMNATLSGSNQTVFYQAKINSPTGSITTDDAYVIVHSCYIFYR